jgi:ribonuclease BN (tRNA processing enzyme)
MSDHVQFIGSGDAFGSGGRFQTCILCDIGGHRFLLDCGTSSLIAMRQQGIDPNSVEAILLTHMHGDHCGGVPFLLLDAMLGGRRTAPLVVAGPPNSAVQMDGLNRALFPGSEAMKPKFDYRYVEMVVGQVNQIGAISVTPYPAVHTPATNPTMLRVQCGGRTVVFTGDTEWTDTILDAARDADLLITECCFFDKAVRTHMNYRAFKQGIGRVEAKSVILTHMAHDMLSHVHEVPELCAHDGMRFRLDS